VRITATNTVRPGRAGCHRSPPGPEGPNILVLEVKKTSNPVPRDCDRARIHAFLAQYKYEFAALIECETRPGRGPTAGVVSGWAKRKRRPMRRR